MKLFILVCCTAVIASKIARADVSDPWPDFERVQKITIPYDPKIEGTAITIKFLVPLPFLGDGGGSPWSVEAGDHVFVYWIPEGVLFIDNCFAGRFGPKDDLRYGFGRFWANGKPCALIPPAALTAQQKKLIGVGGQPVEKKDFQTHCGAPWKVFISPQGGAVVGGATGSKSGHYTITHGMTSLRFEHGSMYLHGVPYGQVADGDVIRVLDEVVYINDKLRFPMQEQTDKEGEQAGDAQPAIKPADKPAVKDQPSTPTSKDSPR